MDVVGVTFTFNGSDVLTVDAGDARYDAAGAASSAVASHEAVFPHPNFARLDTNNIFHGQQVFGRYNSTIGSFAVRNLITVDPPSTIGYFIFQAYDFDLAQQNMAGMYGVTTDRTVGSHSAQLVFYSAQDGAFGARLIINKGTHVVGSADQGIGTFNAPKLYEANVRVVESGSNANGHYVKFADGTLICSVSRSGSANPHSWIFPHTFISTLSLTLIGSCRASAPRILTTAGVSTTSVDVYVFTETGAAVTNYEDLTAIGRWK